MPIEQAPYTRDGNLMHFTYASPGDRTDTVDWRPNEPFEATLALKGVNRGRSSTYFEWVDQDGHRFPMFVTDMMLLLQTKGVRRGGTVQARWHVVKRGMNHGVAIVPKD